MSLKVVTFLGLLTTCIAGGSKTIDKRGIAHSIDHHSYVSSVPVISQGAVEISGHGLAYAPSFSSGFIEGGPAIGGVALGSVQTIGNVATSPDVETIAVAAPPTSVRTINTAIPVPVPQPVPVTITRPVPVPQPVPVPVAVPRPVPVPVPQPVPVIIRKPYPVVIPRPQPVLVPQPIAVPVPKPVPVVVPQPVPVTITKQVPVPVPQPIVVPQPVAVSAPSVAVSAPALTSYPSISLASSPSVLTGNLVGLSHGISNIGVSHGISSIGYGHSFVSPSILASSKISLAGYKLAHH